MCCCTWRRPTTPPRPKRWHARCARTRSSCGGSWAGCAAPGDIHAALGAPPFLAVGHREAEPSCLVEQAVNHALGSAYAEAEALLLKRLHQVTLAGLSRDFHARLQARGATLQEMNHDA
jgi:hypothetical protein